ncbi:hypothetical protein K469DRAFT_705248 [Zopfia rhizophila CBS 207.26]|uniref:Uncharacterized protein n=1 Tax=Zopfia rhizophila CBS 207.26 TaxID=1314779 RepID=A0A6A6D5I5_9PEZI|nr:hypothetical protein K469DRAFT_705248 [Zopfia rhizophila CBS 207.26]
MYTSAEARRSEAVLAAACYCLLLPATACYCLLLPATACYCLLLPATAYYCAAWKDRVAILLNLKL